MFNLKRRNERDELLLTLFAVKVRGVKKVNIEYYTDANGKQILRIVKNKSGIGDKPCTQIQGEHIIKIIREALTNKNIEFKDCKNNGKYYAPWNITQEKVLKNALNYLNMKGIKIDFNYENEYDIHMFKKLISRIFTNFIIPAIFTRNENDQINDNDDISNDFDDAISRIKDKYLTGNFDEKLYEKAADNEILTLHDSFCKDRDHSYKIYINDYIKYFLIEFDSKIGYTLRIKKERFESAKCIDFKIDVALNNVFFLLPRYANYYTSENHNDDEEITVIKSAFELRKKNAKIIHDYYAAIFDFIINFTEKLLSIDISHFQNNNIRNESELNKALNKFKINSSEVCRFLEENDISIEYRSDFMWELICKIVSRFCHSIQEFNFKKLVWIKSKQPVIQPDNSNDVSYRKDKVVFYDAEITDEGFISMDFDSDLDVDADNNDTESKTQDKEYDFFSKSLEEINQMASITNIIAILTQNNDSYAIRDLNYEISSFLNSELNTYIDKIKAICNSKKMSKMISLCDNYSSLSADETLEKTIKINKFIKIPESESDSIRYRNSYTDSESNINYNAYVDVKETLLDLSSRY